MSTLIGVAVRDGLIGSINDPLTKYLPGLASTAYDGVTLRQILQMSSGVKWNEDYKDPASDFRVIFSFLNTGKAGAVLTYMSKLPREAEPGTRFNYNTGETHMETEVLKAALGGETPSHYFSRKIWVPMGMQADGLWGLETPGGTEFGGAMMGMTLRDYGRFGLFILNDGVINGIPVLPAGWVDEAGRPAPDSPQCGYGRLYSDFNASPENYLYPLGYGYNWWVIPDTERMAWEHLDNPLEWGPDTIRRSHLAFPELLGTFTAQGIYGQFIHINRKEKMVSVIWSTWNQPWIDPKEYEVYAFLNAATEAVKKRH
jgi:CubicO group peptidase (beta-lactamase class C family)